VQGWSAWVFDPISYISTSSITKGNTAFVGIYSPTAITANSISFWVSTAASSPSGCYVGIYNAAGTLLASSADFSSTLSTNTGLITVSLSSPYSMAANTVYYIALLIGNSTTTAPTLIVTGGATGVAFRNVGATAPGANSLSGGNRAMALGSGLTALQSPVSGTPSAGGQLTYWFGIK
jgi:hypothetical protein